MKKTERFHKNRKMSLSFYCDDKGFQGEFKTFHKNGNIESIERYVDGNQVGINEKFYKNGHRYGICCQHGHGVQVYFFKH